MTPHIITGQSKDEADPAWTLSTCPLCPESRFSPRRTLPTQCCQCFSCPPTISLPAATSSQPHSSCPSAFVPARHQRGVETGHQGTEAQKEWGLGLFTWPSTSHQLRKCTLNGSNPTGPLVPLKSTGICLGKNRAGIVASGPYFLKQSSCFSEPRC